MGEELKLKKEMAEAIVSDFMTDEDQGSMCLSCGSFGAYPDIISHTSSCIVLKAKAFLLEVNGD
jgi:hypothetical protein